MPCRTFPSHYGSKTPFIITGCFALCLIVSGSVALSAPSISGFHNRGGLPQAVSGDVIDLTGSALARTTIAVSKWPLPFELASVRVTCNGFLAPILFVSPDRVRIQIPWELLGQAEALTQVSDNGISSATYPIPLSQAAPAIIGINHVGAISPGEEISIRAVGLGLRSFNPLTGSGPTAESPGPVAWRILVLIGGVPAPVLQTSLVNSEMIQDDAGVEDVSVQIPFNVPSGNDIPVRMVIGEAQSIPVGVSVAPASLQIRLSSPIADIAVGRLIPLQATVQGSADTSLTWVVDDNERSKYGAISNGNFRASSNVPFPNWTLIRAVHSSGAFATAFVRLVASDGVAYKIVPDNPVIAGGESVTLSLVRPDGSKVDNVYWSGDGLFGATYGSVNGYAPGEVTASAAVPGTNGTAAKTVIHITPPRPLISGTSPAIGHVGEQLTFKGDNLFAPTTLAWFTLSNRSFISADGEADINYSANKIEGTKFLVPHGIISGTVWLELHSDSPVAFRSSPMQMPILPRLRLHSARQRISSGESVIISATAPNNPGEWPITWRADFGTINSYGVFQAPSRVAGPTFARIWACLMTDKECSTTIIEVLPFRIEPDTPVLSPGETIKLRAWQGSTVINASWKAITRNITITPSGRVTAGTGSFDSGVATVQVTADGTTMTFDLSIQGVGAVTRAPEFYDWLGYDNNDPSGRLPLGVFPSAIAVRGDWIYVLSRSLRFNHGPWLSVWLDAYRLDERKRPVWVDSVEAPYMETFYGANLYIEDDTLWVEGESNLLLRFDIGSGRPIRGRPILTERHVFSGTPSGFLSKGFKFSVQSIESNKFSLTIEDHAAGSARTVLLDYPSTGKAARAEGVNGTGAWAAVMFEHLLDEPIYETVVFDITSDPARQIAILPSGGFNDSIVVLDGILVVGQDVYKVAGREFTFASRLTIRYVFDFDSATKRLLAAPEANIQHDGIRVLDLSDPFHPRASAPTAHHSQFPRIAVLGPDYFVLEGFGPQGFDVYPISYTPGVRLTGLFENQLRRKAVQVQDGYLYFTGPGPFEAGQTRGIFEIFDVSAEPYRSIASADRPGDQIGYAIQRIGKYMYIGTDTETIIYDVSNPASPVEVKVIPAPSVSFALSGKYLYAGSYTESDERILIYDVSDPGNPKETGSLAQPDFAYGLSVQNGLLAAALGESGLSLYSIANPLNPALIEQMYWETWGVKFSNNLLFVAAATTGLIIYDVTDPLNPALLSQSYLKIGNEMEMTPSALCVTLDDRGIAFVGSAFKDGRVYGFDIREPRRPRHIFEAPLGPGLYGYAEDTAVWNNRLFIAGANAAYDILMPQNVGLYEALQTYPGAVLPDRYNDQPPLAVGMRMKTGNLPPKALMLREKVMRRR
jgi:uncharacterized protein (TIGR03437 family)